MKKRTKLMSLLLALFMLITAVVPGFQGIAKAEEENKFSLKLVDGKGNPIKEDLKFLLDNWGETVIVKSENGVLDLKENVENGNIDVQGFHEISILEPKGYTITNLKENKDLSDTLVFKDGCVSMFGEDGMSKPINTLVINTGKEVEESPAKKAEVKDGVATLPDIKVVYKDGTVPKDGLDFETFDKENKDMEDYVLKDGVLKGIKAPVGHRMKLGLSESKEDYTLFDSKALEYFNYVWFTVDENGNVKLFDEATKKDLGALEKLTVVERQSLVGEKPVDKTKKSIELPVIDRGLNKKITTDIVEFTITGDGETRSFYSEDGVLKLDLYEDVNYTINIVRKKDYGYKMNGFSFELKDGKLVKENGEELDSISVYQGSYMIRVFVLNNEGNAEKGLKFKIKKDSDPTDVQTREFDGTFLTFDAFMFESYTITLEDNEVYEMDPVHITMKTHPEDGLYWAILDEDQTPEGDNGKLKALYVTRKDGKGETTPDNKEGTVVTLPEIKVVDKDGNNAKDGLDFHTFNKENKDMENYVLKDGVLTGVKAPVGHRMKLGLNESKEDYTLFDSKTGEYFNYVWFTVDKDGNARLFDEATKKDLGKLEKLTVVDRQSLVGEEPVGKTKKHVELPVVDRGVNKPILTDSVGFTITGDGETRTIDSENGLLALDLYEDVNYTINIVRRMDYGYKMNGFTFKLHDGRLVKDNGDEFDSISVYQGSYMIRVYVLENGDFAEKGIKFNITEDTNSEKVQTREFDGKFLTFDAFMFKSYTITLADNDKYEMDPVHITMKTHPDDGLYWAILDEDKIPEGDDGKLKALFINKIGEETDPGDVVIPDDKPSNPTVCPLNKIEVKTKAIPVKANDGSNIENLSFTLFNSTEQKFEDKIKVVDGKIAPMTLYKGYRYFIQLVDTNYEMINIYFEVTDNGLIKFKEDYKELTDITVNKKAVPKETDGKYAFDLRVLYYGKKAEDGIKIKFISQFDETEAVVKDGNVKVRLFEDLTYTMVVDSDKYAVRTAALVVKDKFEWNKRPEKYTFDHCSCNGLDRIELVDIEDLKYVNAGSVTCENGNTTITGMDFKNFLLRVEQLAKESYKDLITKDVLIYDMKLINPFRCEVSKILAGDFKINRKLPNNNPVKAVYELHDDKLVPVEFTQDGNVVKVKVHTLSIYPIVVAYEELDTGVTVPETEKPEVDKPEVEKPETDKPETDKPEADKPYVPSVPKDNDNTVVPENKDTTDKKEPEAKEEIKYNTSRVSGKDRYETAIEISKKYFTNADTVIIATGKSFPDSLSASVLASGLNAPILLSEASRLDQLKDEINRLKAKNIIIVGGTGSVSEQEEAFFKGLTNVQRVNGKDRFKTSLEVAKFVAKNNKNLNKVIVADGRNYPDALAIGSYSGKEQLPIILVDNGNLDYAKDFLKENNITEALIVGGKDSVSPSIEKLFDKVDRISGSNRYETAAKIADKLFDKSEKVALASGENFPDALALSPVAARENMPILLTKSNSLDNNVKSYKEIVIFGGESSVSSKIFK